MKFKHDPASDGKKSSSLFNITPQNRFGLYSAILILLAAAITVVFNVALRLIPTNYTQFDMSSQGLYTISDASVEYLAALDTDVDIVIVAETGTADGRITNFADNYASLSPHLHLTQVDPVQNPSVLSLYSTELDTVVISCPETGKQQILPFTDIIVMDEYYAYYGYEVEKEFDAEGLFTSAIDYVTSDTSPVIYYETGHGEVPLGATAADRLAKNNFATDHMSFLVDGDIPEDCALLFLNQPTTDLAPGEIEALEEYMANGGQVAVILSSDTEDFPNLNGLLNTYGLNILPGDLADESRYYSSLNSAFIFFPILRTGNAESVTHGYSSDDMVLVGYDGTNTVSPVIPMEQVTPARSSISVDPFLTTSTSGLAYVDQATYSQGTFVVGAVATDTQTSGRLIVIGADTLLDDMVLSYFPQLMNVDVFMSALADGFEDVDNISIAPKTLTTTYNTVNNVNLLGVLCILIIPGVFLAGGLMVWLRRRKL